MYINIALIPSPLHSELRSELITLGLSFSGVQVNNKFHLMVETPDLKLIESLAKKHNCDKIYISDSRRALFEVTCDDKFTPTKLGLLKRGSKPTEASSLTGGGFCLVVTEGNQNYYYEAAQVI